MTIKPKHKGEERGLFEQKLHNIFRLTVAPIINTLHIYHIVKLQELIHPGLHIINPS